MPPLTMWGTNSPPLECRLYLVTVKYGGSDGIWFPRQGHKKHCGFLLALPFETLTLGEGSCHAMRTPSTPMPCGGVYVPKTEASSQQPSQWAISETDSATQGNSSSTWSSSWHMDCKLQNFLGQNHLARLLPNSWLRETVKCFLF